MRSPLDTSTLVLAGVAVVLAVVAYLKDPGLPLLGAKNSVAMLGFVIPRMVVAIVLAGLMQVLVPQDFVARHFGHSAGLRALLLATLAGMVTPGGPMAFSASSRGRRPCWAGPSSSRAWCRASRSP